MKNLGVKLLFISLITYTSVFGMNLSVGIISGNETLHYIIIYIKLFGPLFIQSLIFIVAIILDIYIKNN